jgi:hypothetical protein
MVSRSQCTGHGKIHRVDSITKHTLNQAQLKTALANQLSAVKNHTRDACKTNSNPRSDFYNRELDKPFERIIRILS